MKPSKSSLIRFTVRLSWIGLIQRIATIFISFTSFFPCPILLPLAFFSAHHCARILKRKRAGRWHKRLTPFYSFSSLPHDRRHTMTPDNRSLFCGLYVSKSREKLTQRYERNPRPIMSLCVWDESRSSNFLK